ncbi:unnamed protein product [Acanthoscelides obtectus]|uniref:Uncharacterized protein n=1 Tax=Acanthoscelides obtectus TaxID=200917 RepID=A0A9P0QAN9_ACAOB|nr:unnamed protein product [Acanthoscelides obtectus]CAK1677789.1 Retinol dehydrogenase 11 [Acanthoscelides obtectus]
MSQKKPSKCKKKQTDEISLSKKRNTRAGNMGIGYETAADFAKRGANVIIACRNKDRAEAACEKIKKETHNQDIHYKLVDLSSFASVRKLAEEINQTEDHLDILVNNAGVYNVGNQLTEDGQQLLIQTNHYSPFLLTNLLLDLMKKSKSRIVNVSSLAGMAAKMDLEKLNKYNNFFTDYALSKLCNIMFTIELASRLKGTSVTTYSVHPGTVKTEIIRDSGLVAIVSRSIIRTLFKNATEGAQTSIYCAVENDLEPFSGEHFEDCHMVERYKSAQDVWIAKSVWAKSENVVQLR